MTGRVASTPELLGQGVEFARLLRQARALRMHHGLLLTGPQGVGKSRAAEVLARALLCDGDAVDAACGGCGPCVRFDHHADLHRVVIPEDKDEIPVDLVRDLRESLQRLPVEGRARVVIIDPADRLNRQGQNALLKTLEEPGRRTFLLMPTRRPDAMLATVRSRIATLRLRPLDAETLDRALVSEGVAAELRAWVTPRSDGSVGMARALLDEDTRQLFQLLEGYLAGAGGSPVRVARAALEGASGRVETVEQARRTLWILCTILRKELWATLATESTGPYVAGTSVSCSKLENLIDADGDLALRIPPEQVLVQVLSSLRPSA